MSAVGIFGGTFDPIHLGHLITAQSVRELRKLDKIIFIPAFISPHKTDSDITDAAHRLEMTKLAVKNINYFEVSDIEVKRENISFTIDTLISLTKKYDKIDLIIGYDNIFDFYRWKDPDEILKLANLVVLRRKAQIDKRKKDKYYNLANFLETPAIEISASEIRERVKMNLPIDFLVTENVKNYIKKNNLYKNYKV